MIRHIVLFSAKDPDDVSTIRDALQRMASFAQARRFEVSLNQKNDRLSQEMDVVLYAEFATWADLEAYRSHPRYDETTRVVRPLRDQRIVVDCEV